MSDGARTRDNRDHNPVLYQLSYTHRGRRRSGGRQQCSGGAPQPARASALSAVPDSRWASAFASSLVGPGGGTKIASR